MFTVEQRAALRERLLRLAEEDERAVAGAAVGSLAVDGGDRFSDLDLTFGIADRVPVAEVLNDWTRVLIHELDAVHLADLERGTTTYRDHALSLACLRHGLPAVRARGYDDLPGETLARFQDAHVGAVEPRAFRAALAASVLALMREGAEARLPHAETAAQHLVELREDLKETQASEATL